MILSKLKYIAISACFLLSFTVGASAWQLTLPDIHSGVVFKSVSREITLTMDFELYQWQDLNVNLGFGQDILFLSVGWAYIPLMDIGPTVFIGYDPHRNGFEYGFGFMYVSW